MQFCRVYRFSSNHCEFSRCTGARLRIFTSLLAIGVYAFTCQVSAGVVSPDDYARLSLIAVRWYFIFCFLLLFFHSLSHCDILYLKIIKSCSDHCILFMLCFNFLLVFFSLGWLSIRRAKSCHGLEFSFINSSWINTGINTGNHQNHELVSWENFSWNSCTKLISTSW